LRVLKSSLPAWVLSTMWALMAAVVLLPGTSQARLIQEENRGAFSLPWSFRTPPSSQMATVSSRRSPRRKPRILPACSFSWLRFCLVSCMTSESLFRASTLSGSSSTTSLRSRCASWCLPWPMRATPRRYKALVLEGFRVRISEVVSMTRVHSWRLRSQRAMLFLMPSHVASAFSRCRQQRSSISRAPE